MLGQKTVLIVEDEPLIAMELCRAIEEYGGQVAGPVPKVSEAIDLLSRQDVAAAILDVSLMDRDVTPVALLLAEREVPFVLHTAASLPGELAEALPDVSLIMKPHAPERVLTVLMAQIRERDGRLDRDDLMPNAG